MTSGGTPLRVVTVPLPAGFGIALDADTRFAGADVLSGGSPPRLLRLNAAGLRALAELRGRPVGSAGGGRLARRLTDTGLAHPLPPAPCEAAEVTVVIPVRDRAAGLGRCLSALGARYPVVVVDDGSADPAAIAAACGPHQASLIRRSSPGGPGLARNQALAAVTTPLVAFLDSDCVAGPDWISALVPHFADPLVGAVAPRVRAATGPGAVGRYLAARAPIDMGRRPARVLPLTRLPYLPAAALLARRDAVGAGFDPSLRYGEDVDLIWRMTRAGWRVRYDPGAEVRHVEPGRWTQVLARRFRYGSAAAPLARRHPGQVPPLILQAWPAATVTALLARRPLAATAAFLAGTGQLARLLDGWGMPAGAAAGPMARSVYQAWLGAGRWSIQFALPAVAAAAAWPGGGSRRARIGRRVALASLLAGPAAAAYLRGGPGGPDCPRWGPDRPRGGPRLDPVRFALGYLADEAAYGAGVYRGAIAERLAAPLLPRVAWHPPPGARPGPAGSRIIRRGSSR